MATPSLRVLGRGTRGLPKPRAPGTSGRLRGPRSVENRGGARPWRSRLETLAQVESEKSAAAEPAFAANGDGGAVKRRVLLKVSGEALAGSQGFGIDPVVVQNVAQEVASAVEEDIEVRPERKSLTGRGPAPKTTFSLSLTHTPRSRLETGGDRRRRGQLLQRQQLQRGA